MLLVWELLGTFQLLPPYIIPTPTEIVMAFSNQWLLLLENTWITLIQALIGLLVGILIAFTLAIGMDRFPFVRRTLYPYLIISQTIPTVAIAPILVLWLGYDMTPKIVLVVLTTLFPIVINILEGFASVDHDSISLLRLMGANHWQIMRHVKFPASLSYFYSGLKISVSYAFVASVIAEWLGGFEGLGVYMIQAKNIFAYANMFAAIILISVISLILIGIVQFIEKKTTPWQYQEKKDG